MRFYVGVTDNAWCALPAERRPDEVSFWQPSDTGRFAPSRPGRDYHPDPNIGGIILGQPFFLDES